MAILSCFCRRTETINQRPTKLRVGNQDPRPILRKFYRPHSINIQDWSSWRIAISEVNNYLSFLFPSIRPYHFRDRLDDLAKDTSPGSYWKRKGFATKADVLADPQARNVLRNVCHKVKTGKIKDVRCFETTVVVVDSKADLTSIKSRVAWVYPLEVTAMENMFYASFADYIPEDWVPTPASCHDQWCGATSGSADFSNFDASVPTPVINLAFDLLYSRLNLTSYQGGAIPKRRSSLRRLWNFIREYFIYTPHKIAGDSTQRRKFDGVPSGSMFTNLIDTIVSRLIITYLHRTNGCDADVRTYGDDIHFRDCECYCKTLESCALAEFGMTLKIEQPNEHGCLTYCKAECHLGQPFHDGLWFRNILNCTAFPYEAAECLLHMEPTLRQFNELKQEMRRYMPRPSRWSAKWRDKVCEFWPTFTRKWSTL